tara:strand:- start:18 stop:452 length:435 start_codon:yes stop_codon:yes gene_type:complete
MAHFAEIDGQNVVTRVVVVGNDVETAAGPLGLNDMHVDGETWCENFFKTSPWKQTSYSGKFRKQYAGAGFTYDAAKDKFISPQPYASWTLDGNDDWESPVPYPTDVADKVIRWDEENSQWVASDNSDPVNNFKWDASGLTWVSV